MSWSKKKVKKESDGFKYLSEKVIDEIIKIAKKETPAHDKENKKKEERAEYK